MHALNVYMPQVKHSCLCVDNDYRYLFIISCQLILICDNNVGGRWINCVMNITIASNLVWLRLIRYHQKLAHVKCAIIELESSMFECNVLPAWHVFSVGTHSQQSFIIIV